MNVSLHGPARWRLTKPTKVLASRYVGCVTPLGAGRNNHPQTVRSRNKEGFMVSLRETGKQSSASQEQDMQSGRADCSSACLSQNVGQTERIVSGVLGALFLSKLSLDRSSVVSGRSSAWA